MAIKEIEIVQTETDERIAEKLPLEPLGPKRYRLAGSPGLILGLAAGDEIELAPDTPSGYRLLERSGNVCVHLLLKRCDAPTRKKIGQLIEQLGGWLDGEMQIEKRCLLTCTIPVTATFATIEKTLDEISRRFWVQEWMYGNVYDPKDGVTPLNWWPE